MATVTATTASPKRPERARRAPAAASKAAWRAAIAVAAIVACAGVVGEQRLSSRATLESARSLVEHGKPASDPAVQSLVHDALRHDLTQPAALELTALADENRGARSAAANLYKLSSRISRRSLATRLWLVQHSVDGGDVPATLANMDVALRTSSAAPAFVFPALARGLDDPALIGPIAQMVDRPSEWRETFLIYVADNAEPASAAALLFAARDRRTIIKDELDRRIIVRLVADGQFSLARRLDAAFARRPANAQPVADGAFGDPGARYPFGWGLTDTSELGASRESDGGHSVLAYHANTAEQGQVAAQLLTLPPGSYALTTRVNSATSAATPPLWTLSCAAPTRLLVTITLPDQAGQTATAPFSVPPGCDAQWLALTVRPALEPQNGSVASVSITAR
jgi:hypothetical protein